MDQRVRTPQTEWWHNIKHRRSERALDSSVYQYEYAPDLHNGEWFPSYRIKSMIVPEQFRYRRRMDAYKNA